MSDLSGVRPAADPLWPAHVEQIGDALDTITQILSENESEARRKADEFVTKSAMPGSGHRDYYIGLAMNERGKADAYAVAHHALLVAFQPILAQVFVIDVADVLDEDRCEANDATT